MPSSNSERRQLGGTRLGVAALTCSAGLLLGAAQPTVDVAAVGQEIARFTPAPAAVARVGVTFPVGKCVNLSGVIGVKGQDPADIAQQMKAAGIVTIRLPVSFGKHADARAPYTLDPTYLAAVRSILDAATAQGINIIVDLHDETEMNSDPAGHTKRFVGIWRNIAKAFRNEPTSVSFELFNEPNNRFSRSQIEPIAAKALSAIRETNPTRLIVIDGYSYAHFSSLEHLELPDDAHVVPTIHYYEPVPFTHQGAAWLKGADKVGVNFGSNADFARLQAAVTAVKNYMSRTGRVPLVGEFGVIDSVGTSQRVQYMKLVSSAFASVGVQSCAWTWQPGANVFPLQQNGNWLPGMAEALIGPKPR